MGVACRRCISMSSARPLEHMHRMRILFPALLMFALAKAVAQTETTAPATPATPKPVTDYALRTAKEFKPTRTLVYKTLPDRKLLLHIFEPKGYAASDR